MSHLDAIFQDQRNLNNWEFEFVCRLFTTLRITTKQIPIVEKILRKYHFEPNSKLKMTVEQVISNKDYGIQVVESTELGSIVTKIDYNKIRISGKIPFNISQNLKQYPNRQIGEDFNDIIIPIFSENAPVLIELLATDKVEYSDEVVELVAEFSQKSAPVFDFEMDTGNELFIHMILEDHRVI